MISVFSGWSNPAVDKFDPLTDTITKVLAVQNGESVLHIRVPGGQPFEVGGMLTFYWAYGISSPGQSPFLNAVAVGEQDILQTAPAFYQVLVPVDLLQKAYDQGREAGVFAIYTHPDGTTKDYLGYEPQKKTVSQRYKLDGFLDSTGEWKCPPPEVKVDGQGAAGHQFDLDAATNVQILFSYKPDMRQDDTVQLFWTLDSGSEVGPISITAQTGEDLYSLSATQIAEWKTHTQVKLRYVVTRGGIPHSSDSVTYTFVHGGVVTGNHTLYACGAPDAYQNLSNAYLNQITDVSESNWHAVSDGGLTHFVLDSKGQLHAWGANDYGETGTGVSGHLNAIKPCSFETNVNSIVMASNSRVHSLALDDKGHLWACGLNDERICGSGSPGELRTFRKISTNLTFKFIAAGASQDAASRASIAIGTDGKVYTWGNNEYAILGTGADQGTRLATPQLITGLGETRFKFVALTYERAAAISEAGELYMWGLAHQRAIPRQDESGDKWLRNPSPISIQGQNGPVSWAQIAMGREHCLAIDSDGELWGWGNNEYSHFSKDPGSYLDPVKLLPGTKFIRIAANYKGSAAIDSLNRLYTWGIDAAGQLGRGGNDHDQRGPSVLDSSRKWVNVTMGYYHTIAEAAVS
ncbi:RCC1 domain-containing protein [Paraburkholderia caffeinilytica]|uniref:RCC1 domain-containing protein n=1 Tax=Paraburkholderia caffeinilytica TaxID=1761016 RepID=UPI003DA1BA29